MRRYILPLLIALPLVAFAQVKLQNPAPGTGLTMWDFIDFLLVVSRWVVVPTIAIVIIYSGFEMATAKGDSAQIKTAKERLLGAIIAAAVVFSAETIIFIARGTAENILGN
ncbi:MAG TPA: hypothetical protein VJ579_03375 [Candidatus Paceibacterota bacterium]|nr:hypothetical protein [Candidatus Paceibacterota bacterium]